MKAIWSRLVNPSGGIEDEVSINLGFPGRRLGIRRATRLNWPTQRFDNSLGGNWRASYAGVHGTRDTDAHCSQSSLAHFKGYVRGFLPNYRLAVAGV